MARILVIDDEKELRVMLREMLEQAGYEVVEAEDSKGGIERFRQAPVDLVITDLFMPKGSGLEAIQKLKADYPDVKIIAISGVDSRIRNELLARAKEGGALRVFAKPVNLKELREAIQELLGEA